MDKYITKKKRNQDTIKYIVKHVTENTLIRFKVCGEFLSFVANKKLRRSKLFSSNFCEHRFCPMCSWRLAKKDALKISVLIKYLEEEHNKDFIFLTLTAPNVSGEDLLNEIKKFNSAFKKMVERKDIKQMNKGYIRKLEVTYNKKTNTYHPHFHVIMAVNKTYFSGRTYIKQSKWLEIWKEAMDCLEITQVDVRRLRKSKENQEVQEIAKYAAKDSDMRISEEVFDTFYNALRGRQIITYNGLFKEANKLYKNKDLDKYKEIDDTEYVYFMLYRWGKGTYVETERRELTDDERKKINKHLIDEIDVDM